MYRFEYCANDSDQKENDVSSMVFHARMYGIADKYGVMTLKSHAKERFLHAMKANWHEKEFSLAVAEVYSTTPENDNGLRVPVTQIACKHIEVLRTKDDFRAAIYEITDFAADIVFCISLKERPAAYKCIDCGQCWEAVLSLDSPYHCLFCGQFQSDWQQYRVADSLDSVNPLLLQ